MSDIFDDLFGDMMGGRRGRQSSGRERGADLRYNLEITLEEAFRGKTATDPHADIGRLRSLRRLRAQRRLEADDLQDVRRPWARAGATGLLRHRAHLPVLPRARADDRKPVRQMRRLRPRDARAHAVGQRSRRRRGRHAHSPEPARARRACAAARRAISISSSPSSRMRSSSATAPTSIAACRSRWCRPRSAANSPSARSMAAEAKVSVPEGTQSGRQFRLRGKGMPVLRSRDSGDLYRPARGRDAAKPDAAPARTLDGVRCRILAHDPPRKRRLLRQDEGVFRGPQLKRREP